MRSLPRIVSSIPSDVRNFLDRVREYLSEGGEGRFVTLGELRKGGIVGTTPGGAIIPPTEYAVEDPTAPKNLVVTGAFATIIVEWDPPDYLGHAYTEIWASATNDFSTMELVGTSEGTIFSHSLGSGATRYYWIRFVNTLGTVGPYNSTNGTVGSTSQDPDYLIEVLSDAYGVTGPAPFFQIDVPTVINGVTIPAGTYIKQAWIADATISRAKIQNLAVDNAKISDLSVAKLTTGALQVGATIASQGYVAGSSGWQIRADGSAEFANVSVRGTLYGGAATAYASGTGLFAGLDSSTYKFRVGNPAGNRMYWDGTNLVIVGSLFGSSLSGSDISGGTITGATVSGGTILGGNATGYGAGIGLFAGLDGGTYKFRVGNPAGEYFRWDGSVLEVVGDIIATSNIQTNAVTDLAYDSLSGSINVLKDATQQTIFDVAVTLPTAATTTTGFLIQSAGTFVPNGGSAEPSISVVLINQFPFSVYDTGSVCAVIDSTNHYSNSTNAARVALIGFGRYATNGTLLPAGSYLVRFRVSNANGSNTSIDVSGVRTLIQYVKR